VAQAAESTKWEKPWSRKNAAMHLKSEMESLPKDEDGQAIVVELLGQVQRAHQILLSADNECLERAERH
jgi:hypothetical protein